MSWNHHWIHATIAVLGGMVGYGLVCLARAVWWRIRRRGLTRCMLCEGAGWVNDVTHSHPRPVVHIEPRTTVERVEGEKPLPMIGPHAFVGRLDRWCEVCNRPDRDPIHQDHEVRDVQTERIVE